MIGSFAIAFSEPGLYPVNSSGERKSTKVKYQGIELDWLNPSENNGRLRNQAFHQGISKYFVNIDSLVPHNPAVSNVRIIIPILDKERLMADFQKNSAVP